MSSWWDELVSRAVFPRPADWKERASRQASPTTLVLEVSTELVTSSWLGDLVSWRSCSKLAGREEKAFCRWGPTILWPIVSTAAPGTGHHYL